MTRPKFFDLANDYLALRRGLGFDLEWPGRLLLEFAQYVDGIDHRGPLTTDLAVTWALATGSGTGSGPRRRLSVVRQFARHCAALHPGTEIPPHGLVGRRPRRRHPHIYSDAEIADLLMQARLLLPRSGLRPRAYVALFSLLVSAGLRLSEARRLVPDDVDLAHGVLTLRETKFRKSRLVPLHATAADALLRYAAERDARGTLPGAFFRTDHAAVLKHTTVEKTFSRIRQRLGWTAQGRAHRPRIHDLRHTFAVRRLLGWYQEGVDIDRKMLALSTYMGHAKVTDTYWYLSAVPELMAVTSRALRTLRTTRGSRGPIMTPPETSFPALLQAFFQRRLIAERGVSAHTIASYRDTFELLLHYLERHAGRTPCTLTLEDLDAPTVLAFLDHLEERRGNSPRTRNLRLTAIRSFWRYAAVRDPTSLPMAQRVLAIPTKRFDRPALDFLSRREVEALLDAPDHATWSGQRDAVLFAVLYNTGARVSEPPAYASPTCSLDRASALLLHGKGRKDRIVPLWTSTARQLRAWLRRVDRGADAPVFPNRAGVPYHAPASRTAWPSRSARPPSGVLPSPRPLDLAAYSAAHHGDAPAPIRRRHHRHRHVARSRGDHHHAPIHRGRPRHEGGRPQAPRGPDATQPIRFKANNKSLLAFLDAL